MASTTIMKFPDGRTESVNVLTHFEKNGIDVMVFETNKVDNGLKVTGVSYLVDGMYQNIVDQNKWDEVKSYLVDILHDRITNEEYRLVPEEVSVTLDPYHPLSLRDANLDKVIASFENFKNLAATKNEEILSSNEILTSSENPLEAPTETPIVGEIPSVSVEPIVETPSEGVSIPDNNPVINEAPLDIPAVEETPVVGEIPSVEPIVETPSPEVNIPDNNPVINETPLDIPVVEETPIVGEIPSVEPIVETPSLEVNNPDSNPVVNDTSLDIPVVEETPVVGEIPSVEPILETPSPEVNIPDNNPIINETANIVPENNESINEIPILGAINSPEDVTPRNNNSSEESIVTNSYLTKMANIKQDMVDLTNDYINKIKELSDEYVKKIEEKEKEAQGYLAEAKGLNELSRQTFEKTQSMTPLTESLNQNPNGLGNEMLSRAA